MNVLDLFSGIGGFSLGLERAGMRTVAFCEIEPWCRAILKQHWPNVPCYDDVRTITADRLHADGIVPTIICGGFPCQDISEAGKREGIGGERSGLWAHIARLTDELRPDYLIVENVRALARRGLHRVLADLALLGYDAEWDCVGVDLVGATQHRKRLWLLAYPNNKGLQGTIWSGKSQAPWTWRPPAHCEPLRSALGYWPPGPREVANIPGMADGPTDRSHRLKAIGNSIVPAIPQIIGEAIMAHASLQPQT